MIVWLAAEQPYSDEPAEKQWAILGIFSTEKNAVAACSAPNHFVARFTLDKAFPPDIEEAMEGVYRPFGEPMVYSHIIPNKEGTP